MEGEDVLAAGLESRFKESGAYVGQPSTYDDYLRVEDVYDSGKADAREIRGPVQYAVGEGVVRLCGLKDGLRVDE